MYFLNKTIKADDDQPPVLLITPAAFHIGGTIHSAFSVHSDSYENTSSSVTGEMSMLCYEKVRNISCTTSKVKRNT